MTYAEKLEQEKAYKEYEKHLAREFANSKDEKAEISKEQADDWEYLKKENQSQEDAD